MKCIFFQLSLLCYDRIKVIVGDLLTIFNKILIRLILKQDMNGKIRLRKIRMIRDENQRLVCLLTQST